MASSRARELLAQQPFQALLATRILVVTANQIAGVALGWRVYELTHSPAWLGYVGLAEAVPAIALALFAGHVADTTSRHKQMLMTLLLLSFCLLLRFASVASPLPLDVDWQLGLLFLSIVLDGVARAFWSPAYFGMQSEVLTKQDLTDGVSMLSGVWQASAVIGPAMGGLLYAAGGASLTFGLSLLMGLMAAVAMRWLPRKPAPVQEHRLPMWPSIVQGLRFVVRNKIILGAISLDLFAVLFGGAVALLPAVSEEILHAGPQGLGVLRAAPAVGAVLMAAFLFGKPIKYAYGRTLLVAVAGFGICMVVFGLSEVFWISLLALAISGALDHVSVVIRITIMQTFTPEAMRGRVSAVESIFIASSNEIGAFESGITASWWGLRRSIVVGGLMSMGVVGLISLVNPALRRLNKPGVPQ